MKKLMLLIGGMVTLTAYGQFPDMVDSTFGKNGVEIYSPSTTVNNVLGNVVLTANDGMLMCGTTDGAKDDIFVLKVDKDGNPDTSFFGTGKVVYDPQIGANDQVYSMDVQPDGKILLCGKTDGQTYTQGLVMRLNPDGTLDLTFNQKGWLGFAWAGNHNTGYKVKWHDSIIYVMGGGAVNNTSILYMIALEEDGNYYTDFGISGFEYINIGGNDKEIFRDFEITPNKEILVLGTTNDGNKTYQFVQKVDSEGYIMNNFGTNGTYLYQTVNNASLIRMSLAPNGSIYLAGFENTGGGLAGLIVKLTSSGQPDNTFASGNGKAMFNVTAKVEDERFMNITCLDDTAIHVYGRYRDENNTDYALTAVYKSDGSLNTNYFGNGYTYFSSPTNYNTYTFYDMVRRSDGKLVFAGMAVDDNQGASHVTMTRLKKYVPPTTNIVGNAVVENNIALYPNPTQGTLQIKDQVNVSDIKVYNTTGSLQTVLRGSSDNRYYLPPHLPGGLYYLLLNTSDGLYSETIYLQR